MTAAQRIMRQILLDAIVGDPDLGGQVDECDLDRAKDIDKVWWAWSAIDRNDSIRAAQDEFRCSGKPTGLPCGGSRHYEAKAVGRELDDGTWVGWTYWYGGGKHGEPGTGEWIEDAYELEVAEETRVVQTFKRKDD